MIDVVLCASGSDEVRIVHGISTSHGRDLRVVRRCADLAETLAVVGAGIGDAVLIDLGVRGLDREALAEMLRTDAAVIGLTPEDPDRTTRMGLRHVVPVGAPVVDVVRTIESALASSTEAGLDWEQEPAQTQPAPGGRLVAVWGPAGAPGRSTVAVHCAHEAALAGVDTVLVDADTYGPSIAQLLGVLDDAPGLVAACRASARDTLDQEALHSLIPAVQENLRLLTGIGVAARWPELGQTSLDGVWSALAARGGLTIVDTGFCLEEDEELSYDTRAPRRNLASTSVLARADEVIAVVGADPVSVTRLVRETERLQELGVESLRVVINRLTPPVPPDRLQDLIAQRMPVASVDTLPEDGPACRRAVWDGALLAESSPRSALRKGLRQIAMDIVSRSGLPGTTGHAARSADVAVTG
ncbi:MAG: P-loop NTPase [Brachybacterium sp.]|nr:P-loop NTPase [Brachybacterium sp.]